MTSDLAFTPAVELAAMIRRRTVSPVEITRAVLERIERLNGRLGAYVLVHAERAMDDARAAEQAVMSGHPLGPLHGVPVSIKDNLWTAGDRTTSGSRLWAEFVAPEDAPAWRPLRADRRDLRRPGTKRRSSPGAGPPTPPVRRVAQPVDLHAHAGRIGRAGGSRSGKGSAAGWGRWRSVSDGGRLH